MNTLSLAKEEEAELVLGTVQLMVMSSSVVSSHALGGCEGGEGGGIYYWGSLVHDSI